MKGDFWRRLRPTWLGRADVEAELDDELEFHVEMRARELIDEGVDPAEARARARHDFGDLQRTRTRYVERRVRLLLLERVLGWLDELGRDLRIGARGLRAHPGFTATAVGVLALGIGAPTTVLTLVDTLFFERPEHVVDPDRLVRVFRAWRGGGGGSLQHADYLYYRDNVSTLSGLAAYGGSGIASYRIGAGDPDQLRLLSTSANYFDVLGVPMALGRAFRPEEGEVRGAGAVAVVSHGFWTRAMGSDPDAVGSTLSLNGIAFDVVGVAPARFSGISPVEDAPDVWVPIAMYGALRRLEDVAWWERRPNVMSRWLDVVGRLSPGGTFEAVRADMAGLEEQLTYEGRVEDESVVVTPQFLYRPNVASSMAAMTKILLAVVALVLLIAAANVTVLLLSRATTRTREIGIRLAIGAGRGRLARQLLVESLLLGLVGGALGIAVAWLGADLAATLLPFPLVADFTPDGWVLAGAGALSLATACVVGLAPALLGARTDVRSVIQEGNAPNHGGRLRSGLVVSQVALSLVLVAGALLFTRSFWTAQTEDLGFDREDILIVGANLRSLGYEAERSRAFVRDGLERIGGLPGVRTVTTSRQVPFAGDWSTDIEVPPGATANTAEGMIRVGLNEVGPAYFETAGVGIMAGRGITAEDRAGGERVAIVNETLAGLLWPGEDPIGRLLPVGDEGVRVVGLARDATYYELGEETWAQAYLPALQRNPDDLSFFVRVDGDPAALAPAVQAALRELDAGLAFDRVTTMASVVEDEVGRYEVTAVLVGLFGVIAMALAAAGLYGVVSYTVSCRTREIGVRMALGADRTKVARGVLRSGLRLAVFGVGLGLIGTVATRSMAEGLLFRVEASDPLPLLGACLMLLGVTALASAGPARRATRVDPVEAMRAE